LIADLVIVCDARRSEDRGPDQFAGEPLGDTRYASPADGFQCLIAPGEQCLNSLAGAICRRSYALRKEVHPSVPIPRSAESQERVLVFAATSFEPWRHDQDRLTKNAITHELEHDQEPANPAVAV
jgi:hypothetical protein